jgi:hypothetical protein
MVVPVAKEEVLVSKEIGESRVALFGVVVNLTTIGVRVRSLPEALASRDVCKHQTQRTCA